MGENKPQALLEPVEILGDS
jgi:large subunit ribosomal protein L16